MTSPSLTPRRREVARLVAEGLTTKRIAAALGIAERTVQWHVEHLVVALGGDAAQESHVVIARWWWTQTDAA